jgi:NADH-quinone oxidoreductase subunit K
MNFSLINIDISFILMVTLTLFLIGVLGLVLNRNNILITIMSVEIMLLAVNLNFIIFSIYLDDIVGYIFVLFILTIAAAESAVGLAILSAYYKLNNTIQLESIKQLKG